MQPLALPQIISQSDAGETGAVIPAQSNKNSLVGFNDVMSAARANVEKRRADEHASETRRAADLAQIQSEDREAENTVAALRAALT